jgi:hypothetical protein
MHSEVGELLRNFPAGITVSVYMDDIAISSDDSQLLQQAFGALVHAVAQSNFALNMNKTRAPAEAIQLFNCDLLHQVTIVRDERRANFYSKLRSDVSRLAFETYCERVRAGNLG